MAKVNEAKHLVRQAPSAAQVQTWVAEAKALPTRGLALTGRL